MCKLHEGRFPFRKKTRKFRWEQKWNFRLVKSCSIWSYDPGTSRCPTVDLELVQTTRNVNVTRLIPFGNSNRENGPTFLDFPLFLGIFQWDEPTKRVLFTAEPRIPEILTKWKAPEVSNSLRKHPFLLALRRWGRFARNVTSGEERGETDVFAG